MADRQMSYETIFLTGAFESEVGVQVLERVAERFLARAVRLTIPRLDHADTIPTAPITTRSLPRTTDPILHEARHLVDTRDDSGAPENDRA